MQRKINGDVERKDTDRSEGKDTGSSRKERLSIPLDLQHPSGVRVRVGLGIGLS